MEKDNLIENQLMIDSSFLEQIRLDNFPWSWWPRTLRRWKRKSSVRNLNTDLPITLKPWCETRALRHSSISPKGCDNFCTFCVDAVHSRSWKISSSATHSDGHPPSYKKRRERSHFARSECEFLCSGGGFGLCRSSGKSRSWDRHRKNSLHNVSS